MRWTSLLNSCAPTFFTAKNQCHNLTFLWLLRFRWATISCQALLVYGVHHIFHLEISLWLAATIILLGVSSNIFFYEIRRKISVFPGWLPTAVMFFDVLLMTILYFQVVTVLNPFSILYIIYIVIAALLLERKCSYALTGFTIICYASFFFFSDPMPMHETLFIDQEDLLRHYPDQEILGLFSHHLEMHIKSFSYFMFFIFFIITILIVYPIGQLKKSLEGQENALSELEEERVRNEKLAALATFAAGAAHEFATPLSTIAIASGEMLFHFKKYGGDEELISDTRLIRDQVARCKEILYQMAADAGEHLGEDVGRFTIKELVYEAMSLFKFDNLQQIKFINRVGNLQIVMPVRTLTRTIRGLLKNALDASTPGSPIELTCWKDSKYLYFEVKDHGVGMEEEVLNRATEPFYTSKQPGKGMGLGLYLTKVMANRYGGDLQLRSIPGQGTIATLQFDCQRIQAVGQ